MFWCPDPASVAASLNQTGASSTEAERVEAWRFGVGTTVKTLAFSVFCAVVAFLLRLDPGAPDARAVAYAAVAGTVLGRVP